MKPSGVGTAITDDSGFDKPCHDQKITSIDKITLVLYKRTVHTPYSRSTAFFRKSYWTYIRRLFRIHSNRKHISDYNQVHRTSNGHTMDKLIQ